MPSRFTILGDGAMGTACAVVLASKPGRRIRLWCRRPERAKLLNESRCNDLYLPHVRIPECVEVSADFAAAADAEIFVAATPLVYLRDTLRPIANAWPRGS